MKDSNKIMNIVYSVFYQIVCVPILGALTFFILDAFGILSGEYFFYDAFKVLIVVVVLCANIVAVLGMTYLMMRNIKKIMPLYHMIIGLLAVFCIFWIKLYYGYILVLACSGKNPGFSCSSVLRYNNAITFIFVLEMCYFVFFMANIELIRRNKIVLPKKKEVKEEKKEETVVETKKEEPKKEEKEEVKETNEEPKEEKTKARKPRTKKGAKK